MTDNVIDFGRRTIVKESDDAGLPSLAEQVDSIQAFLENNKANIQSIVACVLVKDGADVGSNILTTSITAGDLALSIRLIDASFLERIFSARYQ